MKKIISFVLSSFVLMSLLFNSFSIITSADENYGYDKGINWRYIPESKTLLIDGERPAPFVDCVEIEQRSESGHGYDTVYYVPFTDYYIKETPWQNLDYDNLVIGSNLKCLPSGLIQGRNLNAVSFMNNSFSIGAGAFLGKSSDSEKEDCKIGFMALTENNIISRGVKWKDFSHFYPSDPRYGSDNGFIGYKIKTLYLDGFSLDSFYYLFRNCTENVIINDKKYDSFICDVETDNGIVEYNILEDGKVISFSSDFKDLCRNFDFHKNSFSIKSTAICNGVSYTEIKGHTFKDLSPQKWYYDAVKYESEVELFSGLDSYTFSPDSPLSRAMLVALLFRNDVNDQLFPGNADYFVDVESGAWYTRPVNWARSNGIVSGVSVDMYFLPNADITREDMAVVLYRYANHRGLDTSSRADISSFPDYDEIHDYAKEALSWAVYEGYISGEKKNDDSIWLNPRGNATRAQAASVLMRYHLKNGDPVLTYTPRAF